MTARTHISVSPRGSSRAQEGGATAPGSHRRQGTCEGTTAELVIVGLLLSAFAAVHSIVVCRAGADKISQIV